MSEALDKLVRLIATRDFLLFQRNLELRSEYVDKLGQFELAAYKLACEAERLRRKLELAREALEAGGTPDEAAIDLQLEQEFMLRDQMIEEMTANLFMAMGFKSMPRMSREEQSEMLELYEDLARAYYPQLYPDDEERARHWEEARDVYQQWDLEGLADLEAEARELGLPELAETARPEEQLMQLQSAVQEELDTILRQFPFNLMELLADEEQVARHREEIQRSAEQSDRELHRLQEEVTLLFDPVSKNLS